MTKMQGIGLGGRKKNYPSPTHRIRIWIHLWTSGNLDFGWNVLWKWTETRNSNNNSNSPKKVTENTNSLTRVKKIKSLSCNLVAAAMLCWFYWQKCVKLLQGEDWFGRNVLRTIHLWCRHLLTPLFLYRLFHFHSSEKQFGHWSQSQLMSLARLGPIFCIIIKWNIEI